MMTQNQRHFGFVHPELLRMALWRALIPSSEYLSVLLDHGIVLLVFYTYKPYLYLGIWIALALSNPWEGKIQALLATNKRTDHFLLIFHRPVVQTLLYLVLVF